MRLVILAILFSSRSLLAECLALVNGPVAFDVAQCKQVVVPDDFETRNLEFYQDMTPNDRAQFNRSYKGLLLEGKVVHSSAVKVGLETKKGALKGRLIKLFVTAPRCEGLLERRIQANLREICCDGGGESPCLLGTSFRGDNLKTLGKAASRAGDKERHTSLKSSDYRNGYKFFQEKKYKKAIKHLVAAKRKGELDVTGFYMLGVAYRKRDDCRRAVPVLRNVYDRAIKDAVWADQNRLVRKSNFLLARCYGKLGDAGWATIVLGGYLSDPLKYKKEIRESKRHPDFGRIRSSKEWKVYLKDARKRERSSNGR